jgi:hypothetical protein
MPQESIAIMSHPRDNAVHRVRTTRLRAKRADHEGRR